MIQIEYTQFHPVAISQTCPRCSRRLVVFDPMREACSCLACAALWTTLRLINGPLPIVVP